jgi:uncharacterized protein YdaU (DUF1376 family)
MAQFPALPLFTDAYMADTRHLTAAQHGAYLLLLMTAWRMPDCKLPDDDKFLARCVAMDLRSWKANRDIVMSFWKRDSEQKWYQARLLDERKYVEDKRSKNVKAAKARWLNNKDSTDADAMPKSCLSDAPTPTPTPTPSKVKKEGNFVLPLPEWLPLTDWDDYLDSRSKRGKKATNRAMQLVIIKLDELRTKGHDPTAVLQQSIINGWTSVFEIKENKNGSKTGFAGEYRTDDDRKKERMDSNRGKLMSAIFNA